jgi:hypothetical protein
MDTQNATDAPKKISDYKLNPRWACWMISRGEDPADARCGTPEEPVYVVDPVDGGIRPQGLVFVLWVGSMWREWAASLGFTKTREGRYPHEDALFSGHTAQEFDAWLVARVGAVP